MYSEAKKNFAHHGITVSDVSIDLDKMMEQKQGAITGLTKGIEGLFKKNKVRAAEPASQPRQYLPLTHAQPPHPPAPRPSAANAL